MAEIVKNSFDALPEEILLHIFSYLDGLLDRYNLAQVSHRFNRTVKNKFWRRSIYIEERQMDSYFSCQCGKSFFVGQILKEINDSKNLKTFSIEGISNYSGCSCSDCSIRDHAVSKIIEMSKCFCCQCVQQKLKIERKVLRTNNLVGIFYTRNIYLNSLVMILLSPQSDDSGMVPYPPFNTTSLSYRGKETNVLGLFLKFLFYTLFEVELECPITLTLLRQISGCNNLEEVSLAGELVLPSHFDENNLPRIRTKKLFLYRLECTAFQTSNTADIFFSKALKELLINYFLLRCFGVENFSKCPNLRTIRILMRGGAKIEEEEFLRFSNNLLISANNLLKIRAVHFFGIDHRLVDILRDSLHTNWNNLTRTIKLIWYTNEVVLSYS